MSKELVLIPKRKYEDLLQQTGEGPKRIKETEEHSSTPSQPEINDVESRVIDKSDNEVHKQIDTKPTTCENENSIHSIKSRNRQWLKFNM